MGGNKANSGRAHENAQIAHGADGWHGCIYWHILLLAHKGKENWHNVGTAYANKEKACIKQDGIKTKDKQ